MGEILIGGTFPENRNVISGWGGGGVNLSNGSTIFSQTDISVVDIAPAAKSRTASFGWRPRERSCGEGGF
jgi:hypothetical protein